MSRIDRTFGNAIASYVRFGVSVGVVFVITPLFIRVLGAEDFGLWSLVFALVGVVGLLDFGLLTTTTKYVAESKGRRDGRRRNEAVSALLFLYVSLAVVSVAVLWVSTRLLVPLFGLAPVAAAEAMPLIWILGVRAAVLGLPLSLFRGILCGEQRIALVSVVQAGAAVIYGVACWVALVNGKGLLELAWLNLGAMLVEHLVYVLLSFRLIPDLELSWRLLNWATLRAVCSFGASQFVVNASALVRLRSDPLIVKLFLPLSAVGVYAIGLKVAEYMHLLVKQGVNAVAPLIAELAGEGERGQIREVLLVSGKFALAPAAALAAAAYLLGEAAVLAWIGPEFESAGLVLSILLTATTLAMLESTASSVLAMSGYHRPAAIGAAASTVLNVVLSLLLVRPLGLAGVALGTLIATLLVDVFVITGLARRAYGITTKEYAWRVVAPATWPVIPSATAIASLKLLVEPVLLFELIVVGAAGLTVYLLLFFRFSLSRGERERLTFSLRRAWWRIRRPRVVPAGQGL
jgi:O-antigen/teichoic acid export membrane protein